MQILGPMIFMIILFTVSQVLLKYGISKIGPIDLGNQLFYSFMKIFTNYFILLSLFISMVAVFFWMIILSRKELSFAFGISSMIYITVIFASWFFLKEEITLSRLIGTVLISIGVFFIHLS